MMMPGRQELDVVPLSGLRWNIGPKPNPRASRKRSGWPSEPMIRDLRPEVFL